MNLRLLAARAGVMTLVKTALFSVVLVAFAPGSVVAQPIEKKGTTPYVTHFIFRPLMSIDIPGLGTATNLEAVGTTQNMKGEKMLDKMSARCAALSVASGDKKYIDGAYYRNAQTLSPNHRGSLPDAKTRSSLPRSIEKRSSAPDDIHPSGG
jgi:hypothetical protein